MSSDNPNKFKLDDTFESRHEFAEKMSLDGWEEMVATPHYWTWKRGNERCSIDKNNNGEFYEVEGTT